MTRAASDLTGLLGSRLCHDLISPIGAIANGVELLRLSGQSGPEIDLIEESVRHANARIRFFRVAFGAATAQEAVAARDVRAVLAEIGEGGRTRIDWQPDEDAARSEIRLVFLLLLCLEAAMPRGGAVTVARDGKGWLVRGAADRMTADPAQWGILTGDAAPADVGASAVQFLLLAQSLADTGRTLSLMIEPAEIAARF